MNMLLAFIAALGATFLLGGLARFIFRHFASDKVARIAAFWLAVGEAGARHSYAGPPGEEALIAMSGFAGAALGIFLLWRWLLRRPAGALAGDSEA